MLTSIWQAVRRAVRPFAAAVVTALLGVVLLSGWLDAVDWPASGGWVRAHLPALAFFAVAFAFAVQGIGRVVRADRPARSRPVGLSWWVVVLAAAIVVVAVTGATEWLLAEADHATDRGAARVDAIKTGLGVGAGTAGIFALLLAVRRQIHQEHTAADTVLDATEKRVTELYTKAADQLGSGNAAVRLAGLYALARLADNHADQAETVLNVICAYLRMPHGRLSPEVSDRHESELQEAQVRLTAQRILGDRLQRFSQNPTWGGQVDLTGAHVAGIDLDFAGLSYARLDGATLIRASLQYADLSSASLVEADLSHAKLTRADLEDADLTDANLAHADLQGADLTDAKLTRADFTGARLPDGMEFRNGLVVRT
ncbi:pentapeptide repeat-containing protein [Amycolatopsis sp. NPDC098790]|uniref:pentapeptide repeat-containing protein n=1 Tax=Amycolatopsis sp. NPDC098790 TaxID=3363939 RepID=UPI003820F555